MEANHVRNIMNPDIVSGSEIILRCLLLEGVECVFGYPGGAVLYIYDAMVDHPEFQHLLTRHEQGAIHAADGYARASGKTGVCMATSGPGATNLITGIATAYADSVPLVIFTGNVSTDMIGTDAFQEADIVGMTMPVVKNSYFVDNIDDLAPTIREAFHLAGTGRKGPVLIDIPKDILAAKTKFLHPETVNVEGYVPYPEVNLAQVNKLYQAIIKSKCPVIIAGGGVVSSDAHGALLHFIEQLNIPVTTTLMGLGCVPDNHPLFLGMPGMHGTVAANRAIHEADLLIAIGARFDDRVTLNIKKFAPNAEIAHIDIDAAEIGKNIHTHYPIRGDVSDVLNVFNNHVGDESTPNRKPIKTWHQYLDSLKEMYPLKYRQNGHDLKPQYVMELIRDTTDENTIVTTDVGQHQMWAAQFGPFKKNRSFITSGGLGTMGFGLPSALGAQIACPEKMVVSINGDGGIQMCAQELAVCAIHNLPVKIVVINNQVLGMIYQWQNLLYKERYSSIDLQGKPDFVKLAEAHGVKGLRAKTKEEADTCWREALKTDRPVLIEFVVPKEELVYPMIPQGQSVKEVMLGGDSCEK
ncbi:biosynthetic-type acetolactate synthase large subunit [Evansella sp. AB-P1]|uniref:biosynthetic-type acetolactate synthase large subunit n=1 Tax=Evansella sp. AB-P1 TaxID=3037653 RepID=UPI00241D651F|nr:biosynthetic-type acetolactate synthase large subunit [Evansella sp. AB-P1]MDG5790157.1 biosynthetic-type acetolactate synthase large subunit [Evansella sp. AB-P1]